MSSNPFRTHHPPIHYNPFRHLCNKTTLSSIFTHVLPHLNRQDIVICSLLNRNFYHLTFDWIWKSPEFNQISYIHSGLYMFNRFLLLLPSFRSSTLNKIRSIDLSDIQETLYERVHSEFFKLLIRHLPNLSHLNLSHALFFSNHSLPSEKWCLPNLCELDLSDCPNVTDEMLVTLARGCRRLSTLKINHLSRHKGRGLAAFAAECDHLESVSVSQNPWMGDEGLIALAKFRHIHLRHLDLSGCPSITSVGLDFIVRYCVHLQSFSLADGIVWNDRLNCKLTETLDLSRLPDPHSIARWLSRASLACLTMLSIDFQVLLSAARLNTPKVVTLTLTQAPERIPVSFLSHLCLQLPNLKHLIIEKESSRHEFLLMDGKAKEETIEESIKTMNWTQKRVFVELRIKSVEDQLNLLEW
ncbi:hypothetical protein G6F29_004155 [Rhizopus arrhizus]|nr:hypothetical protein G6F23_004301 [Rhizopus arrhizus]KAG0785678.1 hypothetical protein G6F21_009095 [Rhizopus arrhizus]KAG0800053.1 hypothetical protein G6F22_002612 [Rhizopus arrhizus]KAG0830702.1 hypothetical protein G6F19_007102 [Rhizopus arrhizus]KAG0859791.1 hypothetical protein G6F17_001581 [Rhizopus arrhizus]